MHSVDSRADRKRLLGRGVKIAYESERGPWIITQYNPKDFGGGILPEIETTTGSPFDRFSNWPAAGPNESIYVPTMKETADKHLVGVTLQVAKSEDPLTVARNWAELLELPITLDKDRNPAVQYMNGLVSFVKEQDGRGPGILYLDVACPNPEVGGLTTRVCYTLT